MTMTYEEILVTPEVAEGMLAKNVLNRSLKHKLIAKFARDMKEGQWRSTGEAIKFSSDGALLDGQNRLHAILQSGVAVKLLVVNGLEPEAQEVMDSGAPRSGADALHLRGFKSTKAIVATLNTWTSWTEGRFKHCMTSSISGQLTNAEVVRLAEDHPSLVEAAHFAVGFRRSLPLPTGPVAVAFHELSRISPDDAQEFFSRISELRTTGKGDPVHTLIRRTSEIKALEARGVWPSTALFYLFRSWNAYRSGETLTRFQLGSSGSGWVQIPTPR